MFRRFLPRTTDFFNFFEQHSQYITQACQELYSMCSQQPDIPIHAESIKEIEQKADLITHQCIEALHKTFITPLDRSDILTLMKRMDDIIDFIFGASARMVLYEITEFRPEAKELSEFLREASTHISQAVGDLRNIKNAPAIREHCIAIHHLEDKADGLLRAAIARLFKEETNAILVIKWKEIYERLEKATDRCDDVANILEKVVIELT
jgi:uncharacterized protein Yka (UPF0111/DUF47 family)